MWFKCSPVGINFFNNARFLYQYEIEINAAAEDVFSVLKDWQTWPAWFKTVHKIQQTGDKANGLGSTRITTMKGGIKADETFFVWDENKRIAFYTTAVNTFGTKALAEMYELTPLAADKCRFNYTVGVEPAKLLGMTGVVGKKLLEPIFRGAPASLAKYMEGSHAGR